jgi:hypothetical protein
MSRAIASLLFLVVGLLVTAACGGGGDGGAGSTPAGRDTAPSRAAVGPPPASLAPGAFGVTYYVRPDGGDSTQCDGRADAAYPGNGSGRSCAWDHPFRALPPGGTSRLAGGDALVVADGSYRMGYGAPGDDACDASGAYDCIMPPVPSGPSPERPTRILGAGWDSGCANPPQFWGAERPWFVMNLTDSSNVAVACLEITDHSQCVEGHSGGLACERDNPPYGDWASYGLMAEDSANVLLRDLDIHGLASGGVHAGRLKDWTVVNVRIAGNGLVGWDGDLWDDGSDSNSGTLSFKNWLVEWNGCAETYPEGEPAGCWAQEAGGYGDGVGTGETGGTWIIEDSQFLHNTSDGLDLLYHTNDGSITLTRVRAEGNAGNQVKVTGKAAITDSVFVGNCAFFEKQKFTHLVDHCRALGNTLAVFFTGGERVTITNSTFYAQGDGLIMPGQREGYRCNGKEELLVRNSVFLGGPDYFDPSDLTFLFFQEDCGDLKLDSDYNLIYQAKNVECGQAGDFVNSGPHDLCGDPGLAGPNSGREYGMKPAASSPAIDGGTSEGCPATDILGRPRPADGNGDGASACDIGAYEGP